MTTAIMKTKQGFLNKAKDALSAWSLRHPCIAGALFAVIMPMAIIAAVALLTTVIMVPAALVFGLA